MDWIFELPKMVFDWVGFDGSKVKAARFQDATIYCSELGNAVNAIKRKMQPWEKEDIAFALWGVGNHGGGIHTKALCAQFLSSWGWCKKGNECDNSF